MDDYYKKRYEEINSKLSKVEHEVQFYRNLAWRICGGTSVIAFLLFWSIVMGVVFFLIEKWNVLSVSDKSAIIVPLCGFIFTATRYRKVILNWPEELYLNELRKVKEIDELTK